jgi:hypothetical protein
MTKDDISFVPHSDMNIENSLINEEHKKLIKQGNYSDATALLNEQGYNKGFRASLFNSIQNKINVLQDYMQNEYTTENDSYYSDTEPTDDEIGNARYWVNTY